MRIKIVDIGNSKGIRLPKSLLEQYVIGEEVTLELHEEGLLIKPIAMARHGWKEKMMKIKESKSTPVDNQWQILRNKFDEEEWTW